MKKNKIISLFLAAVLAITSLVVTSVSASAEDIPYYASMSNGVGNDVTIWVSGINDDEISFLSTWGSEGCLVTVAFNYGKENQLTLAYSVQGSISMGMFAGQGLMIKSAAVGTLNGVTEGIVFTLDTSDPTVKKAVESIKDCTDCKIQSILITKDGNKNFYGNAELIDSKFYADGTVPGKTDKIIKDAGLLKADDLGKFTYTGKNIKPDIVIKDGDKTLTRGTDYTLSYKDNKNIGKATVTAALKGDYTGTITKQFSIVPSKPTLKAVRSGDNIKLTWTASKGCGKYQIQYSTDGGKTYKTLAKASSSKTSYTAKLKKGNYRFRIRGYKTVDKTTYYGNWSKVVKVK